MHGVDDAVKDQNLRTGRNSAFEQDLHDMSRGRNLRGGSVVGLEFQERFNVIFFQLGEAQGPTNVAGKSIGSSQDDIILDRDTQRE